MNANATPLTEPDDWKKQRVTVAAFFGALFEEKAQVENLKAELETYKSANDVLHSRLNGTQGAYEVTRAERDELKTGLALAKAQAESDKQAASRKLNEAVQRVQEDWRKDSKTLAQKFEDLRSDRAEVVRQRDTAELSYATAANERDALKGEVERLRGVLLKHDKSEALEAAQAKFETLRQFTAAQARKLVSICESSAPPMLESIKGDAA